MKNFTIYILLVFTIFSCKKNNVDGIEIGNTLYTNQSIEQNKKLNKLITRTLNKDKNALSELTEFGCGAGAGCYDLGIVISQIVYKMGELEFIKIASELNSEQKKSLSSLLHAGLEYGYAPYRRLETEFPHLNKMLD